MQNVAIQAARRIPPNRRSITGRVPVAGKSVPYESALERDFATLVAFEDPAAEILSQPITITYTDAAGRSRRYTPDFLVHHGAVGAIPTLVEVRYRADLWADWAKLRPKFRAAVRYSKQVGWRFRIQTEIEIRGRLDLEAIRFLLFFRERRPDPFLETPLLATLARLGSASAEALLLAAFTGAPDRLLATGALWRLVALRQIEVNLTRPLGMASILRLAEAAS